MYTQTDWQETNEMLKKRWLVAALPAAAIIAAAIVVFVIGRIQRSDSMWMITAALTVIGGGYLLFIYGVYVRPVAIYRKHIHYMLNGRMRETSGVFKFFSADLSDREGLDCYAMLLNVGEKDDPEDDRLFYYDAHKPKPVFELGQRVTVLSNDKMVSVMKAE